MKRWDALKDDFLKDCQVRGLSETTIDNRMRELERLGNWLKRRRPKPNLETIDDETLIRYIRARSAFRSKSSVQSIVSTMRCMGEYLLRRGVWQKNPLKWIQGPKVDHRARLPRRIGKEDLRKLLQTASEHRESYCRYLMVTILAVLYGTGIRRGELERLDVNDWDREEGILKIDGRKTGRERLVPVSRSVWECMEVYLPRRHNVLLKQDRLHETALFVNKNGGRLIGTRVGILIHALAKKAQVPLVTLHQFRHSCASDLMEGGVKLPQIQMILGHAFIASTMRYTHIADPERHRAIQKHPINDLLCPSENYGECYA